MNFHTVNRPPPGPCALACRHCGAEAVPHADPDQLTFYEGVALLHQIREFGDPLPQLIRTGGDPLRCRDLFVLIDEAHKLGIGISITPAATPALTYGTLVQLKEHGVEGLGLSLDGSTPLRHDSIRGVSGTFDRTVQAMRWAQQLQMPLQVNTLVAAETAADLPAIYELLKSLGLARWSLFFLISVGRGKVLQPLSPGKTEMLTAWIYETSPIAPLIVATTEAPSYRRVALEKMRKKARTLKKSGAATPTGASVFATGTVSCSCRTQAKSIRRGFCRSWWENIRQNRLVDTYRNAPDFLALHDPTKFEGRCGACQYHMLCGVALPRFRGQRQRARRRPASIFQSRSEPESKR